ncbi:hypothetical protein ONS96_014762 [Cadophora gregata f. sp. sojae]|nr:hypothetical protein ONS96_014762 [Cadophora gregata f. sp. sojae]
MAKQIDGDVLLIIDGLDEIEDRRADTIELLRSLWGDVSPKVDNSLVSPDTLGFAPALDTPPELVTHGSLQHAGNSPSSIYAHVEQSVALISGDTAHSALSFDTTASTPFDNPHIKLLFVSRTQRDIESRLHDFEHQKIEAREVDLLLYVASEIDHRITRRQLRFSDRMLKEEIIDGLVSNAQGV